MQTKSARAAGPGPAQRCEVDASDLRQLGVVHEILALLNDPRQGAKPIAELVRRLPVLEARVRRAHGRSARLDADRQPPSIAAALALIGNRGFEEILFELLEDLTVLHSSQER